MHIIDIAQVPNQSFSVTLEGVRWDIRLKQATTSMIADLSADGVQVVSGQRIVAGTPIIPYQYLAGDGNFLITTENDDLPNWELFGVNQIPIYATFDEISAAPPEVLSWPKLPAYQSSQPIINNLIIVLEP